MTNLAARTKLLRAPADRPAGRRGVRGPVAAVAALAAIVPLSFQRLADESSWAGPATLAAGLTLIAGALLLWTARRRVALAAAILLIVAGGLGAIVAIGAEQRADSAAQREAERWAGSSHSWPRARGAILTKAEAEAVPKGLTRKRFLARFGTPSTRGVVHFRDEPDLHCLGYRRSNAKPLRQTLNAFCFRNGRYVELSKF